MTALRPRDFGVLAFDRPGHGWSDRPDGIADASPARQAALLRRGLDALGIRRAIILGHSWSGRPGGRLRARPARPDPRPRAGVSGALIPGPGGSPGTMGRPYRSGSARPSPTSLRFRSASWLLPSGGRAGFRAATGPARLRREGPGSRWCCGRRSSRPMPKTSRALHAFVTLQAPRMPDIAVPTAIVAGDSDRIVSPVIHAEHAGARHRRIHAHGSARTRAIRLTGRIRMSSWRRSFRLAARMKRSAFSRRPLTASPPPRSPRRRRRPSSEAPVRVESSTVRPFAGHRHAAVAAAPGEVDRRQDQQC